MMTAPLPGSHLLVQVSEPTSFNRKPEEVAVNRATTSLSR